MKDHKTKTEKMMQELRDKVRMGYVEFRDIEEEVPAHIETIYKKERVYDDYAGECYDLDTDEVESIIHHPATTINRRVATITSKEGDILIHVYAYCDGVPFENDKAAIAYCQEIIDNPETCITFSYA